MLLSDYEAYTLNYQLLYFFSDWVTETFPVMGLHSSLSQHSQHASTHLILFDLQGFNVRNF